MAMNGQRPKQVVRQIIGRVSAVVTNLWAGVKTVDSTPPDYRFWDNFRRGKVPGFKFSSLLAKAVTEKMAAWVVGDGFEVLLQESDAYTDELLKRLSLRLRGMFYQMVVDLLDLGNQYILINADGSFSVPSPDTVKVEYDALDYRRIIKATITNRFDRATITDEYRLDGRTVKVKNVGKEPIHSVFGTIGAGQEISAEFENLIGRVPLVHFANERSANETHGRPAVEALYELLSWYDDLIVKALMGARRLSNPILVFFKLTDAEATRAANAAPVGETYMEDDGTLQQRDEVDIDEDTPALFVDGGGDAKFIGPAAGFTNDIRNMLKSLYLLAIERLHLPDVVMGFEMSSARASAVEQIKTFFAIVTARRITLEGVGSDDLLGLDARGGILEVFELWLLFRALTDSQVKTGQCVADWPSLDIQDATLTKQWADAMHGKGLITDESYVKLSERMNNPAEEVEAARAEIEALRPREEREDDEGADDEGGLMDEGAA